MVLPPNVSEARFNAALGEFRAAVGADWVFSSDADVALYRDSYSVYWGEAEERIASGAVAPVNVEQVQQIVRIANKYRIPLYAISTGRNLTYGGSAPNMSGSLVVDLKRMNRILDVDDKRNFALVEPGVSYFELYQHITERNLKVMMDTPDPGWGSPVGNSLDRGLGPGPSPYRDHFGSACGMEVVTAEGDVLRTGMGAMPNSEAWQDYRYGVGPAIDGLFAQSNFGIVTKMGFWLRPLPETYFTATVGAPRYEDLEALVHETNYLEDSHLIGQPGFRSPLNTPSPALSALMANGWPSDDALRAYVASQSGPVWEVRLCFYGPEEVVRATWQAAKRRYANAISGATFQDGELTRLPMSPEQALRFSEKPRLGIPSLEAFTLAARNPRTNNDPADGHADIFVILPRKVSATRAAARVLHDTFRDMGMPSPFTPFFGGGTSMARAFTITNIIPTYRDPAKNARSRQLLINIMNNCAERGWAVYRTAPAFQDLLASKFSFNNNALLRFQEKLKDSIDPNGILAPGRYGVWPAAMRRTRP